jgi:hypothetical protein
MVAPYTTWSAVCSYSLQEDLENSCRPVIVTGTDASNQSRLAIDKAVDDDLEAYQTCLFCQVQNSST